MRYGLGLDIGTSNTKAATSAGALISGVDALRMAATGVADDLKRRLGDPSPVLVAGVAYAPEALIAAVVRDVVATATADAGGLRPDAVVLTYPAIWGPYRRERFAEVPALAGLEAARPVTEAEAVATWHGGVAGGSGRTVVVYDLGAGTFDTAVLRGATRGWEILGAAEGADRAGGLVFDDVVLAMMDEQLAGAVSALDRDDPDQAAALVRMLVDSRRAKEALSAHPAVTLTVALPSGPKDVSLSRTDFEHRIAPLLDPTLEAVHRALRSAGVGPREVEAVLLAGGSTRIPLVARRVEAEFGRPVRAGENPEFTAALGAALIAGAAAQSDSVGTDVDDPYAYGLTGGGGGLAAPRRDLRLLGIVGLVLAVLAPLILIVGYLALAGSDSGRTPGQTPGQTPQRPPASTAPRNPAPTG